MGGARREAVIHSPDDSHEAMTELAVLADEADQPARARGGATLEQRTFSSLLDGGRVASEDGSAYLARRWP